MSVKGSRRYSIEAVAAALQKAKGLVTLAAVELHADYRTVRRMVEESKTLQKVQADCKAQMGDFTEGKLFEAIGRGEPWAVQFYLRTQAKARGYGEAVDVHLWLAREAQRVADAEGLDVADVLREAEAELAAAARRA